LPFASLITRGNCHFIVGENDADILADRIEAD
jgi:hypothetical protein